MTRPEFSDTFTTMLNSYNTQAQFGEQASKREIVLDEYEKSVLLTQAQDIITKSYFDGTLNQQGQGFDDSTKRQVDFSNLITVKNLEAASVSDANELRFDDRGILFKMPDNVLFILNERLIIEETETDENENAITTTKNTYVVVPSNYKEYDREMSKPYAQPLKKQAWRLLQDDKAAESHDMLTELIPKFNVESGDNISKIYRIRYVRRPAPIILEDLPNGLQIDKQSTASDCELNPALHIDILNKAVELALATRGGIYQAANNRTTVDNNQR